MTTRREPSRAARRERDSMLHPLDSDHSVAVMTGCALVGALVCAGVFGVMMGPTAGLVGALVRGLRRRSARGDL